MDSLLLRLGMALAIGLLVGLERGWRERDEPAGSRTAGIRTYGISGLLGGILAVLSQAFATTSVFIAGLLGFALVFGWFSFHEARHDRNFSVTGTIAAICVFALGGLAVVGDYRVAAGGGAGLAAVLASREAMHGVLRQLTWIELRSAIVLAVMTAIVLPLLPNRTIDPWGGLNPWEIWFFTVLTAALSFLGYIAVRVLGAARGLLVSALAGALVSSTAVTLAFARTAHQSSNVRSLSGAAALAAMVSILRVTAVVALLQPHVLPAIVPAALAAAATFALFGLSLIFHARGEEASLPASNPFALGALLLFALLFAVVSTASAALVGQFGGGSVVATSALSGAFDVDVAVLSALRLFDQGIPARLIGEAVLAALGVNALGRLCLAIPAGPVAFWLPLVAAAASAFAAGLSTFLLLG
ncbi:DUF4010 domain-containing protein [Roseococcus sp. SYP-B2431]|uniref:MgtC/SapB family protein n=1 Tax=Roseococcus sp. SYP-B2431 TaxID=2496640 RepID=UPI00103A24C1|nr:MgtC/SapB family protein [Roseococcus sp. SYP-B2431]TCH97498.1 DUF4010 domain-containing protein [Roseococcus sp. SYP-B2431]